MKMYAVYLLYWYKRTNTDAPCFTGVFVPADYIFEAQVRYAGDLQDRWRRIRSRGCHRSNALVISVTSTEQTTTLQRSAAKALLNVIYYTLYTYLSFYDVHDIIYLHHK